MINLTVKTLDSRNHQFSVDDDITVEQFKRHIAETVDIPAETQRIIYCGRVLQDSSRLNDYDVDGKVVHLVQRPPPSANPPSSRSSRSSSPHPQRRIFRGLDHGNAMFLGSVAFPTNLMDSQGIVPPSPTHSHAGSRLNVARRMLRRAEQVIALLENPNGSTEQTPVEDPQDEVTPVIEARVIVPSNSSEPLDEAAILSAVQNYSLLGGQRRGATSNAANASSSAQSTANPSANTTADTGNAQASASTEENIPFPENATRSSVMADALTMLSQLQLRFAPFLDRYNNFMRDDPVVPEEEISTVQTEMNRVSEVMHFLGHAYHSLSDIILRVNFPPPRPLLCRPILIHHSAVLQAGIPIQVEAQINLSNERPTSAPPSQTTPAGDSVPPSTTAPTATPQPFPSQAVPLISTVRVPIPLEIRSIVPPSQNVPYMPNSVFTRRERVDTPTTGGVSVSSTPSPATTIPPTTSANTTNGGTPSSAGSLSGSNPEVEFIMEVTPEGITIDSLDAGMMGSPEVILRGALNGQQPPNLIQSIMQMAGHIMNRRGADSPAVSQQPSMTSAPPLTPTPPTQNSQARGNNQTHPTSATQTRSTARPHVHLQQQTMQGGFDPFLPCNSHHVSRRRPQGPSQPQQSQTAAPGAQRTDQEQIATAAQEATTQLNSLMNSIVNSIRTSYQRRFAPQSEGSTSSGAPTQGAGESASPRTTDRMPSAPPADSSFYPFGPNVADLMRNNTTLAELLGHNLQDCSSENGENLIFADFITLLCRNITISDVISFYGGNIAPLARMAGDIQNFCISTIMNGSKTSEAVTSGVERFLNEIQPFLDTLAQIPIRDDIDIQASVRSLLRARLPAIFNLGCLIVDEPANLRQLVDHCVTVFKEFFALALRACADGAQGVDQFFDLVTTPYMQGIPADLQTLVTCRSHFRQILCNSNVPHSTIEPFIVRKTKTDESMPREEEENSVTGSEQPMETEEITTQNEASSSPIQKIEDFEEPLPSVVIGSEAWHNQVPADWVPIIARDAQRQKKQNSQPPFSDAYLAGMPSKRRKIVHGSKGRQGLPLQQVIAESVRRAVTSTGLSSAAPLEVVAQAAGASAEIQTAYRGLLRSSVQPSLRNNDDFTPERFPHATNYFGGP